MTNQEVIKNFEGLMNLSSDLVLPIQVSFAVIRNKRILFPIYEDIIKTRDEILIRMGDDIEGNGQYSPKAGFTIDDMTKELTKLGNINNDIQIVKVPISQFVPGLSIGEMDSLFFMIEEE